MKRTPFLRITTSSLIALTLVGCYANRSVLNPWNYSPQSSSSIWKNPPSLKLPKNESLEEDILLKEESFSLAELIDIALKRNTQTKLSWAKARLAAANYAQSQSSDFPNLSASFNYERFRSPDTITTSQTPFTPQPSSSPLPPDNTSEQVTPVENNVATSNIFFSEWGPQLSLAYTILDFGQQRATSMAAKHALYFADFTHNRTIQQLIQVITLDYYNYAYQKELLRANLLDLETAQTTLDAATLELNTGVKDVSDFLQAKTQFLQTQITYVTQKQNVQNAFAALLNDMGLPATLTLKLQDLPSTLPQEAELKEVEELIEIALKKRPDLLAQQEDLLSKEANLKAAKRLSYPNIQYTFDLGRTYFKGGRNDNYDFESAISLNFPLFAGFYYKNGVKIAQANKEQSKATLLQTKLAIYKDITTTHYNAKVAFETLYYSEEFLLSARKQYQVSLSKYKVGTATILDVVSAQSSLADARASRARAMQQWYDSLATLAYATGIFTEPLTHE